MIDLRTPENEDWIKFRTWNLPDVQTVEDIFHHLRGLGELPEKSTVVEEEAALRWFTSLPSFAAAPQSLKDGVALWLDANRASAKIDNPASL